MRYAIGEVHSFIAGFRLLTEEQARITAGMIFLSHKVSAGPKIQIVGEDAEAASELHDLVERLWGSKGRGLLQGVSSVIHSSKRFVGPSIVFKPITIPDRIEQFVAEAYTDEISGLLKVISTDAEDDLRFLAETIRELAVSRISRSLLPLLALAKITEDAVLEDHVYNLEGEIGARALLDQCRDLDHRDLVMMALSTLLSKAKVILDSRNENHRVAPTPAYELFSSDVENTILSFKNDSVQRMTSSGRKSFIGRALRNCPGLVVGTERPRRNSEDTIIQETLYRFEPKVVKEILEKYRVVIARSNSNRV